MKSRLVLFRTGGSIGYEQVARTNGLFGLESFACKVPVFSS